MLQESPTIRNLEIPYVVQDNKQRVGLFSAYVTEFDNESCVVGSLQDITELKQTENVLRELTARFQTLFDLAPHPMLISRFADGKLINVNETFTQVFGYEKEEVLGRTSKECGLYMNLDDRAKVYQLLRETGSVKNLEILYRLKNGEIRIGLNSAEVVEVDNQKFAIAAITDITDRKQAEEALRESEERLRLALASAQMGTWEWDFANQCGNVDAVDADLLGWGNQHREFTHEAFMAVVHPDDHEMITRQIENALATGEDYRREFRIIRSDGTIRWMVACSRTLLDSDNRPLKAIGINYDVTERKQAENDLRELTARFQTIFNLAPQAMVLIRLADEKFISVNQAFVDSSGYQPEDVLGRTSAELNLWTNPEDREKVYQKLKANGSIRNLEMSHRLKNGDIKTGLLSAEVIEIDNEKVLLSALTDITDRKRAEEALQESEKRLNLALVSSRMGVWEWDIQTGSVFWSPESFDIVDKPDFDGRITSIAKLFHPEDVDRVSAAIEKALNDRIFFRAEFRMIRSDGKTIWVASLGHTKYDEDGTPLRMVGTVVDITERKQAEEALSASEGRYRLIAEHSTDLIARHAPEGQYLYVSPASRTLLGYEPEEMLGRTAYDYVDPEDKQPLKDLQAAIFRTQDIYVQTFRFICKDGSSKWVESTVKNIRDAKTRKIVEILSISRDITKRKQAEEALRASEERFRKLAVNSPNYIHLIDLTQKRAVYHNRQYMFGYENAELNNYGFLKSLIYFDDKEQVREHWENLLQGNSGGIEFRMRKKDGTWEWLDCRYNALYYDANGKPLRSLLTVSIITERKLAEELLQKYTDELDDLYQNAPCGYYSIDGEGTIVRVNDTELKWLGYRRDEIIGKKKYWELVHIGELEYGKQQFALLQERGWIKDLEGELMRKDGSTMPILLSATAVKDENGNFLQSRSTIYDMTERKLAEEIIRKSNQQLQALSAHLLSVREEERTRIAREIHDEFGPTLTILKFDLFALGKKLNEDQHDLLEKIWLMSSHIDEAVASVRKICSDLRPAILDFGLLAAIEWLTTDFEKSTGIGCRVHLKTENFIFTEAVSTTLFRILQEGLTNVARHAEATCVYVVLEKTADKLELTVQDNGKGISGEMVSSIHSFGLLGIKERARLLGGEVTITGDAQTGTLLQLLVPLPQQGETPYGQNGSSGPLTETGKYTENQTL